MGINLNIVERIMLLELLPKEGNFITLRSIRKLREDLSLSEEERKIAGIKPEDNDFPITKLAVIPNRDFEFEDFTKGIIISKLKKLDTENKLEDKYFTIYEKFIDLK